MWSGSEPDAESASALVRPYSICADSVAVMSPPEQASLVHRMQRVDEHMRAAERQSGRDAAVAESGHDVGFGRAGEPGLDEPARQIGERSFVHCPIIQACAPRRSALYFLMHTA